MALHGQKIMIGALSGLKMTERREACRATWMSEIRRHRQLDAVFLLASDAKDARRVADELYLPCPDAYACLPQRTREWLRWALRNSDAEWFLKCDDDTYVVVDRLSELDLAGKDFIGRDLGGFASGGAGYLLSRKAAELVAEFMTTEVGAEDVCVAQLLSQQGIPLHDETRLLPWPASGPLPTQFNDTLTVHAIPPAEFYRMHQELNVTCPFRIVIPTSNRHAWIMPTTLRFLNEYWPGHPPVDVVHHEVPAPTDLAAVQYYVGPQSDISWCDGMLKYLELVNRDEFVLLMLDDYALCRAVSPEQIERAGSILLNDPAVFVFYLTWMPAPVQGHYSQPGVVICAPWAYTVHTQAGLWRKSSLIRILKQLRGASVEAFELSGSEIQNQGKYGDLHLMYDLPAPPVPSWCIDSTDKTYWPLAYHNLSQRGKFDIRHLPFLERAGLRLVVTETGENRIVPEAARMQCDAGWTLGTFRRTYIESRLIYEQELLKVFSRDAHITVLDAGACEGEDALRYARLFPNASVYAVEAVADNVSRIKQSIAALGASRVQAMEAVLSDANGNATLYLSSGQPFQHSDWDFGNKSSSLLPPQRDEIAKVFDWLKYDRQLTVQTCRLDALCQLHGISEIDFIHLDVQGAEFRVLHGAGDLLNTVRAIWISVFHQSMYIGQPSRDIICAFLEQRGFRKSFEVNYGIQADVLYVRTVVHSAKCAGNDLSCAEY